ncbi:OmpA family protein [Pseudoclavibacter helvolus]|uniref:Outer membrane protein OmpA-like peptidoglycan-associated protein n=1 Tax=Pseudoclavibacter helvolus TaxID=255205 RepID=A0A7W4UQY3_9MICO|nr:OmpA family protein [Pseudoclavibacter helvolus]MBB2958960.1 outer membrane protein OmpA-like peptidoglycan-associated protein [Pseudoclavibacter helvolus]
MSATGALGAIALVSALALGAHPLTVDSPDDLPEPTQEMLNASVTQWNPDGSVTQWSLEGSVDELSKEVDEGPNTVVTLKSDILFDFNSAAVPDTAGVAIVEAVKGAPQGAAVTIGGHTDSVGDPASNLTLSQQRADVVATIIRTERPDLQITATATATATHNPSPRTPPAAKTTQTDARRTAASRSRTRRPRAPS